MTTHAKLNARAPGCGRWVSALALSLLCGCDGSIPALGLTAVGNVDSLDWNEFFVERRIHLRLPDSGAVIRRIAKLVIAPDGHLFIPDGRAKRILRFDRDGGLRTKIGTENDGTFQIGSLGTIAVDPVGNVFAYDRQNNMVSVLERSTFRVMRQYQIRGPVSDFIALGDGSVVTYYPGDATGVFKRFDAKGKEVAAVHRIRDQKLRLFHGRVHNGGITRDPSGDIFGIQPAEFQLVQLTSELKVRALLRADSGDSWAPRPRAFPAGLSPTDYGAEHRKWWDSFLHIGRPFTISPGVILVTVYSSAGLFAGPGVRQHL